MAKSKTHIKIEHLEDRIRYTLIGRIPRKLKKKIKKFKFATWKTFDREYKIEFCDVTNIDDVVFGGVTSINLANESMYGKEYNFIKTSPKNLKELKTNT